ncbi:MAG: alpha-ketoacid dehydrogenase subunit beta [Candidatus Aenigmatarchaeota archaeon]
MTVMNIVQAVNSTLKQEMKTDNNIIVLGEDVGVNGGVFRATEGLLKLYGKERVIDTPLSEAGIIGTSIGLSVYGIKPVAEIQFSGFLYAGLDHLISHASRMRNRTRGRFTCPMVVRTPYSGGIHAPEHHSESMEALLIHTPGLKVVIPSTPSNTKGLLAASIRDPDPVVFMEPKRVYRAIKEDVPDKSYTIPLGEAEVVTEGSDVTLISWGAMMKFSREAVEKLKEQKINCELIDLRTVSPIDTDTIIKSVKKTGRAVIVHEAPRTCGLGAEISAQINERALLSLKAPVERVTGYDTVIPLYKMESYYLPDVKKIIKGVWKVVNF